MTMMAPIVDFLESLAKRGGNMLFTQVGLMLDKFFHKALFLGSLQKFFDISPDFIHLR
jgi:hypothetical protein